MDFVRVWAWLNGLRVGMDIDNALATLRLHSSRGHMGVVQPGTVHWGEPRVVNSCTASCLFAFSRQIECFLWSHACLTATNSAQGRKLRLMQSCLLLINGKILP